VNASATPRRRLASPAARKRKEGDHVLARFSRAISESAPPTQIDRRYGSRAATSTGTTAVPARPRRTAILNLSQRAILRSSLQTRPIGGRGVYFSIMPRSPGPSDAHNVVRRRG